MSIWNHIAQDISALTNTPFQIEDKHNIGGGCINSAYSVRGGQREFFIKMNRVELRDMFEAEYEGLNEIFQTHTIRVPKPLCTGQDNTNSYLVMEYLELGGTSDASSEKLGFDLAKMHRITREQFGWSRDNTIGSTPQKNELHISWIDFWRDQRLSFQLGLAQRKGYRGRLQRQGEQLLVHMESLFTDHQPEASLLHGDLWSGNYAVTKDGHPVIFDPATYFGDRETDLAMTELFGGFPARFYDAYHEAYPIKTGYAQRKTLYNLYHILNHLNLFGSGYLAQAERMIDYLLSEIR